MRIWHLCGGGAGGGGGEVGALQLLPPDAGGPSEVHYCLMKFVIPPRAGLVSTFTGQLFKHGVEAVGELCTVVRAQVAALGRSQGVGKMGLKWVR